MKFTVTMKDPDTLYDAVSHAVKESLREVNLQTEEEAESLQEIREEALLKLCGKWFEYKEYLCVEIDTEAGTCTVLPAKG